MLGTEFKAICHDEFVKRGFKRSSKNRNVYYLKGIDKVLSSIYIQTTQYGGGAAYINLDYYIGDFDDPKSYPTHYESDLGKRMVVWSKDTFKGEHYWNSFIGYREDIKNSYSEAEIRELINKNFDEWAILPVHEGRKKLLELFESGKLKIGAFGKTAEEVFAKLKS